MAASALASAICRRLWSRASAFSIPFTCCSALDAILTMAVEISPLLAASSSLMAEKSLALLPIWLASPTTATTTVRSRPPISSIARDSRSSSVGMPPTRSGRRSPAPNRSAAPTSWVSGRSTMRTVQNTMPIPVSSEMKNSSHRVWRRCVACRPRSAARAMARRALGQRKRPHVAQQGIGGAAGQVGVAPRLLRALEIGEGVRHRVRHLDPGLVVGDLVDDVAVGGGEGGEPTVAALHRVGGVALLQNLEPQPVAGADQVLLRGADLRSDRSHQPVAEVGAPHQQGQLSLHRLVQRAGSS